MRKVTTYDRLRRHVFAWAEQEIDTLLVLGRPGTGKSHAYRDALQGRPYHLFSARKTPIRVYIELYDAPSLPVVLAMVNSAQHQNEVGELLVSRTETESHVAEEDQPPARHGGNSGLHNAMQREVRKASPLGGTTIQEFQIGTCAKPKEALS